eukprot:TRINITY_DN1631_c0_g2_i3.p1 TRINITY_DN1631_c0_g2~~TRINITY_DN1631_c0_g2_i3.p1  ORF type:complete len:432 (-),score=74.90 TRINITY_DN1631_c0_g2_i3:27-1322(-)
MHHLDPTEVIKQHAMNRKPISAASLGFHPTYLKETTNGQLRPVILVPSFTGSELQARIINATSRFWYCKKQNIDWFRIFLGPAQMLAPEINCWMERISLDFNATSNRSKNATGSEIMVPDFGGLEAIAYLDTLHLVPMWNSVIKVLTDLGYKENVNLRGAPYDWRVSPADWMEYQYPRMKQLFEETYAANNNTAVAVASLSMGCPYFLNFLNRFVSQEWKDKYIHSWTAMDGAFGGSSSALAALLNPGGILANWSAIFVIFDDQFLEIFRTWSSLTYMLPHGHVYGGDKPYVSVGDKTYTTLQFPEILKAAGANVSAIEFVEMEKIGFRGKSALSAPGVAVHCLYGYNVTTPSALHYNASVGDGKSPFAHFPTFDVVDGDGTVQREGLDRCKYWAQEQSQPAMSFGVKGMKHAESVQNDECIKYFVKVISS